MKRNKLSNLLLTAVMLSTAAQSFSGTLFTITIAPPPLRVYSQPLCPGDGYIWTPGYWAYGPSGYYWVNGAWVLAPQLGYLFTPGYWQFTNGGYFWLPGHWGRTVGYYGGVDYGFGYTGVGFYGGRWEDGHFFYNQAYSNVDERRVHGCYRELGGNHEHPGFHGRDDRWRNFDGRLQSRDQRLDDRDQRLNDRDRQLNDRNQRLNDRDQRLNDRDRRLDDRNRRATLGREHNSGPFGTHVTRVNHPGGSNRSGGRRA